MLYIQDMDPGHAKILNKPEKGDTRRMKKPAAEHVSKTVSETVKANTIVTAKDFFPDAFKKAKMSPS